ncbi:aldose 1-epimerase family protein [Flavobacteriaceae bacterium]|nr:aldose 1-epimerase family protein [Flavobacteriaceae bacterium]
MSTYTLENHILKATFKSQGAELISLLKDETEYIWQGNPEFWNRHTPVLFPFVGAEKNNQYFYKGETYHIGQHGFARDKDFTVVSQDETSIVFQLEADEASKEIYPFDFVLQLKYTLVGAELTTAYIVKNNVADDLYFSIGGHPAFNCPFEEGQAREDYIVVFDNDAAPEAELLEGGCRTGETFKVFEQGGILDLPKNVFDKDALVFNPNPFTQASFVNDLTGKTYMNVKFNNFPYLGIWSKNQDAPFVCIEPWHGIADAASHNQELTQKEGIIKLVQGEEFNCEYSVEIPTN